MGRPPCRDKVGIKKGPWTPEEDIILVSYIQEHGPCNWRSVPINAGLMRCSKSCRLRWTNYLRPGIKRGNFTPHEERIIIHLQATLGNRWAAIASYLPQRTDNDIKNYWNTYLKKKIKNLSQATLDDHPNSGLNTSFPIPDAKIEKISPIAKLSQNSTYASSTENISRLLQGWMRASATKSSHGTSHNKEINSSNGDSDGTAATTMTFSSGLSTIQPKEGPLINGEIMSQEELDCLLSFENVSNLTHEKHSPSGSSMNEGKQGIEFRPPLSDLLEKWLMDEAAAQEEITKINQLDCLRDSMY